MSSFDKTVKLACKPKAAPPKAKYLDPIIAASYSEDGAIHDVCKALVPRLREPNSIVVFKALIVLHTMIRNGATDNVLSYLASEDILKLKSVSTAHWEGYDTPRNLQSYALYLDSRIRVYKELKHDPIRVQSDSNRDVRVENSLQQSRTEYSSSSNGPQRSKTIMGRKLRAMTVEKGLLRETKAVQKCVNVLVDCTFFLDNLEDELNVTALRMLVKDLLILFQALNEGVINVLEHYFEMSRIDAETALGIYRNFCTQTEKIAEYLSIANKLQNLLHVPIPSLRHAPISLIKSLEEYLKDTNFEQNRIEYRAARIMADKNAKEVKTQPAKNLDKDKLNSSPAQPASPKTGGDQAASTSQGRSNSQALVDFFSSMEEEKTVALSHVAGQAQQLHVPNNPFAQRQSVMMTEAFPEQPHVTGFMQPQHTATPNFPYEQSVLATQAQHRPFSSFITSQAPQPTGFLQPQATGVNPFRQSMLFPQMTGMAAFGGMNATTLQNSLPQPFSTAQGATIPSFAPIPVLNAISSPPNISDSTNASHVPNTVPQRPASTPLTSTGNALAQDATPVIAHQTGSRNPFGIPQRSPPPVPKLPTLRELVTGAATNSMNNTSSQPLLFNPNPLSQSSMRTNSSAMSEVASSFAVGNANGKDNSKLATDVIGKSSLASLPESTAILTGRSTGLASTSSSTPPSLQPQTTGFAGIKPFKPTSSFGAALLESLPPLPQSQAGSTDRSAINPTTGQTGAGGSGASARILGSSLSQSTLTSQGGSWLDGVSSSLGYESIATTSSTGLSFLSTGTHGLGTLNSQQTGVSGLPSMSGNYTAQGSNFGAGLRPQTTGTLGGANPFRASMFSTTTGVGVPSSQFNASFSNPMNPPFIGGTFPGGSLGDAPKRENGNNGTLL